MSTAPCDNCEHRRRCGEQRLACPAFCHFVVTGRARGPRRPDRKLTTTNGEDELIAVKLANLRRQWRRQTLEHKRKVQLGLRPALTAVERSAQRRARRATRWRIDARLRERYLRWKREDATRRARRNGVAPAGSESHLLHRIDGQRRRRQVERERDGRTLSGPQFKALRIKLGLTIYDVALEMRVTYHVAKQWQRAPHGPPGRAVAWLTAVAAGKVQLIRGRQPTARGQGIWIKIADAARGRPTASAVGVLAAPALTD